MSTSSRAAGRRGPSVSGVVAMVVVALLAAEILTGGTFGISIGLLIKVLIAASLIKAIVSVILGGDQPPAQVAEPEPEAATRSREELERIVLRVATQNDGYVTPEALVLHGSGLTLGAARELLEDLAASGGCEVDADDEGHLHYRFRTNVGPARDTASPQQWLDQESRRMVGDGASSGTRLDA